MKKSLLLLLIFNISSAGFSENKKVCLTIDQKDTGNKKYPNIATEVDNFMQSFNVFHGQKFCFDLNKNYYMQYFLWETSSTVVYGTKCLYEPQIEHEGKTLLYEGYSGATPCPIIDGY